MRSRKDRDQYYLAIAKQVSERSTCLRRFFGAVIVKDDTIVATGYNGVPSGRKNCCDMGTCIREDLKVPRGERYELCRSVHAEANALIQCDRKDMKGATLYLYGTEINGEAVLNTQPCSMCKRLIINSGITQVVTQGITDVVVTEVSSWVDNEDVLNGVLGY